MINLTVCIGSSCHVKGSRQVVHELQALIKESNLSDKIDLNGTFCMGKCQQGVCVTINDVFYSVDANDVKGFFKSTLLPMVK